MITILPAVLLCLPTGEIDYLVINHYYYPPNSRLAYDQAIFYRDGVVIDHFMIRKNRKGHPDLQKARNDFRRKLQVQVATAKWEEELRRRAARPGKWVYGLTGKKFIPAKRSYFDDRGEDEWIEDYIVKYLKDEDRFFTPEPDKEWIPHYLENVKQGWNFIPKMGFKSPDVGWLYIHDKVPMNHLWSTHDPEQEDKIRREKERDLPHVYDDKELERPGVYSWR